MILEETIIFNNVNLKKIFSAFSVLFNNSVITSIAPPPPTSPSPTDQQSQTTTIRLNPLLGVAPLGPVPLSREHFYQLTMLEAAYHHLPHPSDSERIR